MLKTKHIVQLKWLNNQISKIANEGAATFTNVQITERAYKKMNENLIIDDSELEHFMTVYLSKIGTRASC